MKSLLMLCVFLLVVPFSVHAQAVTPVPPLPTASPQPLPFDILVTGTLSDRGAESLYRFELPLAQDVVVTYNADHIVVGRYCVQVTREAATAEDCYAEGRGGDSDPMVMGHFFFAGEDDPTVTRTVELVFSRPLAGVASYQILAYPLTPRPLVLGNLVSAPAPPTAQPYHSYTVQADHPTLPFTFTSEENAADGNFLWAASEPYKFGFPLTEDLNPLAERVDGANNFDGGTLKSLDLFYLGGNTFRVLVNSLGAYTLRSSPVDITPLDAGETVPVTLSYRDPLNVFRTASDEAGEILLRLEVIDGAGSFIYVYTLGNEIPQTYRLLGIDAPEGRRKVTFDLPNNPAGRFVVIQIPAVHTRAPVTLEVEWEPKA